MQIQSSTKMGRDGRPVKETYQVNSQGAVGPNGKRITERRQMYDNSESGLQKMAHERMLGNQGRKIVQ